jgi:lipase chaperone LimK
VGEVSLDDIVEYMKAEMRTLPEPANREALDLLQAYLSYLASISEYDEIAGRKIAYSNIEELTARQQWVMDLRRLYFDDVTVAAFFAEDEAIDDFTLKRLELLQQGASPSEISALETRLPQPVQVARRQAASVQDSLQLRHQHSDPATLRQARSERFGNEAAERLAQLDEERAIWKSRLQQYHRFTQDQRGEPDYEVMVQAYRDQHFSVAEQRRLDAALISLQTARQPLGVGSVED